MGFVALIVVFDLTDEIFLLGAVTVGIEEHAIAGQAVSTRAACFLVVALHSLGQIVMHHKPHIRLVYAHAEGDRCDNYLNLVPDKLFLGIPAHVPF